jgi:hypothetical protein
MPAAAKWMFVLTLNAVLSGFFGLGVAALHFFWLEFATVRWPKVQYTEDYEIAFAAACAAAVFVLTTFRQISTHLTNKALRPGELAFVLIFIVIVMVAMTPVPGSNFPTYLYERNSVGKKPPSPAVFKRDEADPLHLKRSQP